MISNEEKLLIFLSFNEIPNKKQEEILQVVDDFDIASVLKNAKVENLLSKNEYHKLLENFDKQAFESAVENMENSGIKILTIFSENYPKRLIDLPDRPLILYAKGDLELLDKLAIGIVGTRMPTNYGKIVAENFADRLARSGFVVISGLCYGVDEIAHKTTLQAGGKTIAVVGSGFNNIYPSTNTELSKQIASVGLLLSEYPPSFKPKRYTFPLRNRIIAGLSDGVLIVEAGLKSGTIHTKEYATEYGKDIFAVPGNITNPKSELTNTIIKMGQAECVLSPDDIVAFYGVEKKAKENQFVSLSFDEQKIVELLADGEQNFEYLADKSKISVNILNSCLTTLEIRGLIRKLPAQCFALVDNLR